jgi:CheY-like chemotaxis protein
MAADISSCGGSMQSSSILVVEDDEAILETIRFALEAEGYTVFTARNGLEGLQSLRWIQQRCLILLDLMMPIMDGWDFAKIVAQDGELSRNPIILVTAFCGNFQPINYCGIIRKPIDLATLNATVGEFAAQSVRR